jgi:NAD(P)-dependent dehydrogenase (short-subunit alcohol dehydrogenase family)
MDSKICLITGANSGIGKISARELAKMGMTIVMVCRNEKTGREAQQEIIAACGHERVDLMLCDLSSQQQIIDLAKRVYKKYDRLDVLINNAGLILENRQETVDGYEYTFAVNHLAPFLLTNLLLELLRKSPEARVITVSSEAHRFSGLELNDLQSQQYTSMKAYGMSKLANILFTMQLSKELEQDDVVANCLHPGVVATNFAGTFGGLGKLLVTISRPFMIGPEKGAETTVFLASSPKVKGISGLYFKNKRPATPSRNALSDYNAKRLWEESIKLTRLEERLQEMKSV